MSTLLSWYPRPKIDTGLGLHDSSDVGANPPNIEAHAKALRTAGISWYKILEAGGNKVERCRIYLEHDIMPIVRLYVYRPHPDYIVYPGQVAAYVAAGVRYFEMGNEPNISPDEWAEGRWPEANNLGRIVAEQWLKAADMVKREGGIPLVYAWTPGGTYDHAGGHRRFTIDFLQHLQLKGALGALEGAGVAIHPRPHNNPPDTPPTSTNTVTFREHEWYVRTYRELVGWVPPMFATEHGYSIGDSQNANFPHIDQHLWTEYNQELFERMNPSHPKAIPSYLFCLCYWLETEGGVWRNDQLADGWYPDGLRLWGQRLASMRVTWNRTIQAAPTPQPTPIPKPEVPVTDKLTQMLIQEFSSKFIDLRGKLPVHRNSRGEQDKFFRYADSRLMEFIALHYSAGQPKPVSPLSIAQHHVFTNGWAEGGYHFVIDEGNLYYMGSVDTARAHIKDRNHEALGICFTGTYDLELPASPDVDICKRLIRVLDIFYGHKKEIHGHNWFMPPKYTACPGRIVELIPSLRATPTPPPPPVAPIDSLVSIAKDKSMQLISPNWDTAIAKAAVKAGYTAPLGNEITFKEWIFQLWGKPGGKPGSKTEAVFYVLKGDWGNVKHKTL